MDENITPPGLVEDPRSAEDRLKDYPHIEVAPTAVPLKWERGIEGAPIFSDRDQNGSGSCVAQSSATALETLLGKVISAHPIYARRMNSPATGMWLQDAGNIVKNLGTTTEDLDPSQKMNDQQMSLPVTVPTPINGFLYAFPNVQDIDQIAEAIELHKHCKITINANLQEYAYSTKPVITPGAPLNCAHDICGIYYFTDTDGQKCILIKESWGPNNIRLRVLTEAFIKGRGTGSMYHVPPVVPTPLPKPVFHFSSGLHFALKILPGGVATYDPTMMNNYSVKMLQDILKYEGLMDIKITSTGNYLQATAAAVLKFQLKYQVDTVAVLTDLQGKVVGPKTIAKLNSIYDTAK